MRWSLLLTLLVYLNPSLRLTLLLEENHKTFFKAQLNKVPPHHRELVTGFHQPQSPSFICLCNQMFPNRTAPHVDSCLSPSTAWQPHQLCVPVPQPDSHYQLLQAPLSHKKSSVAWRGQSVSKGWGLSPPLHTSCFRVHSYLFPPCRRQDPNWIHLGNPRGPT